MTLCAVYLNDYVYVCTSVGIYRNMMMRDIVYWTKKITLIHPFVPFDFCGPPKYKQHIIDLKIIVFRKTPVTDSMY